MPAMSTSPVSAPLDRRNEVWEEFKKKYPGIKEAARFGIVNATTAAGVADQAKAVLRAHPEDLGRVCAL